MLLRVLLSMVVIRGIFNVDQYGAMIKIDEPQKKKWYTLFGDTAQCRSPNARRAILEKVLRDGAAWEVPTTQIIARGRSGQTEAC